MGNARVDIRGGEGNVRVCEVSGDEKCESGWNGLGGKM